MTLYNAYRPKKLEDVRGNKGTISSLRQIMSRPRKNIPHAFLFSGPKGCGKTTLARICAGMLGVDKNDLLEIDSAQFRGIDTVRDIRRTMNLAPMFGPVRVWVIDECHAWTKDAMNAMLKALEDTPEHAYFMLATTDPEKLLPTLRDRCTVFTVSGLPDTEMSDLVSSVCAREKAKVPEAVVASIVEGAQGSARAALVILDKVIDLPPKDMTAAVEQQVFEQNESFELVRLLMNKAKWPLVAAFLKQTEQEPESLRRLVLGCCSTMLLNKGSAQAAVVMLCFEKNFYDTGKAGLVMACWAAVNG